MAQLAFNATGIKPAAVAKPQLPISDAKGHPMIISDSELVENAAKTGGFLALTLTIIEGPSKGEEGLYRINLFNPSAKAVAIAESQLAAICLVTGVIDVKDSQQLHNIPFRGVVGYQKGEDPRINPEASGYTEVKGVLHMDGNAPGKGSSQPVAQNNAAAPPTFTQPAATPPATPPAMPPREQQQSTPSAANPLWGQQSNTGGTVTPPWTKPA